MSFPKTQLAGNGLHLQPCFHLKRKWLDSLHSTHHLLYFSRFQRTAFFVAGAGAAFILYFGLVGLRLAHEVCRDADRGGMVPQKLIEFRGAYRRSTEHSLFCRGEGCFHPLLWPCWPSTSRCLFGDSNENWCFSSDMAFKKPFKNTHIFTFYVEHKGALETR